MTNFNESTTTLKSIKLSGAKIRNLNPCTIKFDPQFTAITGETGCGKSTILALAACAYQNANSAAASSINGSSYKINDFLVQVPGEEISTNISIEYKYRPNQRDLSSCDYTRTINTITANRWQNYNNRLRGNVLYIDSKRSVPYFERTAFKNYKSRFYPSSIQTDSKITKIISRIFAKSYKNYSNWVHSQHNLPVIINAGVFYSGFNMSTGELRVIDIVSSLLNSKDHTLVLIDEIDFGLNYKVQCRFINELKKICEEKSCQIICTTFSELVWESLTEYGRIFVKSTKKNTIIDPNIGTKHASILLGNSNSKELSIFVEDRVARIILQNILPPEINLRTKITHIGSDSAVMRQMSSCYLEKRDSCISILDGDMSSETKRKISIKNLRNSTERRKIIERMKVKYWAEPRIIYLPGNSSPEQWLLDRFDDYVSKNNHKNNQEILEILDASDMQEFEIRFNEVKSQKKSKCGIKKLIEHSSLSQEDVIFKLLKIINKLGYSEFENLNRSIKNFLSNTKVGVINSPVISLELNSTKLQDGSKNIVITVPTKFVDNFPPINPNHNNIEITLVDFFGKEWTVCFSGYDSSSSGSSFKYYKLTKMNSFIEKSGLTIRDELLITKVNSNTYFIAIKKEHNPKKNECEKTK